YAVELDGRGVAMAFLDIGLALRGVRRHLAPRAVGLPARHVVKAGHRRSATAMRSADAASAGIVSGHNMTAMAASHGRPMRLRLSRSAMPPRKKHENAPATYSEAATYQPITLPPA